MKYLILFGVLLLSSACGKTAYVPENSYAVRVHALTTHGVDAMHHARFASAENALQRALHAAWLSADPLWIGRAQYHLGALFMALEDGEQAAEMLQASHENATLAHDLLTQWRSMFALALLLEITPSVAKNTSLLLPDLQPHMPADVYLSAARLAQLQGRRTDAEKAYVHVQGLAMTGEESAYAHTQAMLGLALLARDSNDTVQAVAWSEQVVKMGQKAGLPMLAAHAFLLQGELLSDEDKLQRAWKMYEALDDEIGHIAALQALLKLKTTAKKQQTWQLALEKVQHALQKPSAEK